MLLRTLIVLLILTGRTFAQGSDAGMVRVGDVDIDRYEYPNRIGAYPEVNVTWYEAQARCTSAGKRLCTEREWEHACRGSENHTYPYGNTFDPDKCNTGYRKDDVWRHDRGIARIGDWGECVSGYGAYDMSGNVWEWVDGWYSSNQGWRVVRGGSWFQSVNLAGCDARYGQYLTPEYRLDLIGFRCCRDASGTETEFRIQNPEYQRPTSEF